MHLVSCLRRCKCSARSVRFLWTRCLVSFQETVRHSEFGHQWQLPLMFSPEFWMCSAHSNFWWPWQPVFQLGRFIGHCCGQSARKRHMEYTKMRACCLCLAFNSQIWVSLSLLRAVMLPHSECGGTYFIAQPARGMFTNDVHLVALGSFEQMSLVRFWAM